MLWFCCEIEDFRSWFSWFVKVSKRSSDSFCDHSTCSLQSSKNLAFTSLSFLISVTSWISVAFW